MNETILVPFRGDGGGVDTLSWGQCEIWRPMMAVGSSFPLGATIPAPPGTTVASVADMLRFVVGRHQSLRTRIVTDADGTPRQHVATSGSVPLEVVHATGAASADAAAARLLERFTYTNFDYPREWPVRMAVVLDDGTAAHVVAGYCHVATDIQGIDALVADVLAGGTGVPGTPPLAQVRQQRTAAALRENAMALRHAAKVLRTIPARRFRESTDPRQPRWWQVGYHSPASHLAVRAIAGRTGVPTTPVLLAGFAVALHRVTGTSVTATKLLVHNRFRPGFATSVSPLAQSNVAAIDVADSTFDEVVGKAWRAMTQAARYSYFDPNQMAELVARVGQERGTDIHVDVTFNDRRRPHPAARPSDGPPTAFELAAAREHATVRWEPPMDTYDHTAYFYVNDVPDTLDFELCADTHRLSPADMETLVRSLEDVFVTAALDP